LVLFNPNRVLKGITKPPAKLTIPKADKVGPCLQDKILQTPIMLISAEALKSLQDIIIKQDIYMFNKTSKQSLQRYI